MPIPLPNLDDHQWSDLVAEGRALIPLYAPDWTDHNIHDPGITFIELFSWLAELDIYRLNRIPDRHKRKFLALIGIQPQPPQPGRTLLSFTLPDHAQPLSLPATTEFVGNDPFGQPTPFRTQRAITLAATQLQAIQVKEQEVLQNVTDLWRRQESFPAFGTRPQVGSELYLGFSQPLPVNVPVSLFFTLAGSRSGEEERRRLLREDATHKAHHSVHTVWEYLAAEPETWRRLPPGNVDDDTRALTLDGAVTVTLPQNMAKKRLGNVPEEWHYLRCRIDSGDYDAPPVVGRIVLNGVVAEQSVPVGEFRWTITRNAAVSGKEPSPGDRARFRLKLDDRGEITQLDFIENDSALPLFLVLDFKRPAGPPATFISTWLVLGPIFNEADQKRYEGGHRPNDGGPLAKNLISDIDHNELQPTELTTLEHAPSAGDAASYTGQYFLRRDPPNNYQWQVLTFSDADWENREYIDDNIHRHLGSNILPKGYLELRSFAGKHHALVFFLVYILSPDDRRSRLCVRSDDAIRVWLNGYEIPDLAWLDDRDAETVPETCADIYLNKGPNILLAAVAETHVAWAFSARIENAEGLIITTTKPHSGQVPITGDQGLLAIEAALLGIGTGRPQQQVMVPAAPVWEADFQLATLEHNDWRVWSLRPDFDASLRPDAHFMLEPVSGRVTFGDGDQGRVPPKDAPILATSYVTRAEKGNVAADVITGLVDSPHNRAVLGDTFAQLSAQLEAGVTAIVNTTAAAGGRTAEPLADAIGRAIALLEARGRAVTLEDYEALALATPGVQLARAKALANFDPVTKTESVGTVTVIVMPYLPENGPPPSQDLKDLVYDYLDRRRLIGTHVKITGPTYVEVAVQARVRAQTGVVKTELKQRVERVIDTFLDPLHGGPQRTGWPFGRDVYRSEVLQVIDETPGVDCVLSLMLVANRKDPAGNIPLAKTELTTAGSHQIEIEF